MNTMNSESRSNMSLRGGVLAILGLALLVGGCDIDGIVEVPDPDVVTRGVFADPENLDASRAGAIREFARAYAGTQNDEGGQILLSGLLADELYHSGTFTTRTEIDARNITLTNASNTDGFFWLQRARNHGEIVADLFAESDRTGTAEHAELLALVGYTYVMAGENYCSGVPFSSLNIEGETTFGEPRSRTETLQLAMDAFQAALDMGVGGDVERLANLGMARAHLNLGDFQQADAQVDGIPTDFVWHVSYSGSVVDAWNAVWNLVNAEKRWSAAGSEGTNGLPYLSSGDPRTPTAFTGPGFDATIDHYEQLAYDSQGDPIPLATGVEARLIEAEWALQDNRTGDFYSIHTNLRATVGLGPVTAGDHANDEEREDFHFQERAYWMWLTSHRLGDLRRMVRQYGRDVNDIYPIGPTERDQDRGDDVTLPVPFDETNNPNFSTEMCDPSAV